MSLLISLIAKKIHILTRIYFIFLIKRLRPNLKVFQHQIWTSVKRSGKKLTTKANLSAFFQISCYNFRLKSYKLVKQIKFEEVWGELEARNCF